MNRFMLFLARLLYVGVMIAIVTAILSSGLMALHRR